MKHSEVTPAVCPLTESQKGVYLECIEATDSVKYNIPLAWYLPRQTDAAALIKAVVFAAERIPAFHMTIGTPAGVPSMQYQKREVTVAEKTVADFTEEYRDFLRPFDLENGPLFRFEYLHTPNGPVLLSDFHHLIFDGTSIRALLRQIAAAYEGTPLPAEELTLADAALDAAQPADPERVESFRQLFRDRFDGMDCDTKPLSDVVVEDRPTGGGTVRLPAPPALTAERVCTFAAQHGISENAVVQSAFAYTLAKCNGMADSFYTTAHHGRMDARLMNTVGMFVRTLPMGCHIEETASPAALAEDFYRQYYQVKQNDCVSFGELVGEYGMAMDVSFIFQADLFESVLLAGEPTRIELPELEETVAALELMLLHEGTGYRTICRYDRGTYTKGFVCQLIRTYFTVLEGMLTAETLGQIPLTDAETRTVLDGWNKTESGYDAQTTVVELFRQQVQKHPENICLVYEDKRFTYRQVEEMTDALAARLLTLGVTKEKVVGVLIPRCEYMLICALGVLKAGGAYLPLDPTYPPERLNLMMQDSGAMLLIADPALSAIITEEFSGHRMSTEEIPDLPACTVTLPDPAPEDLFVMLYTSGSTGTPKGVMFAHSNTLVTTQWVKKYFGIDETARVTAYASYGFDAHAFDMYPAITAGAQLHIISDAIRLDFPLLRDYYNQNGITHTVMTTQVGRQFSTLGGLTTLRHLSVAGEKLTPPAVPEGFAMYNLYGPTEGSIVTSAFRIEQKYADVPIGTPVDDLKLYVVDGCGRLLPPGGTGELWISGPHVTRGYLNRPEKTAEAYGQNPFDSQPGYERIYRTGDIVRLLPDGNLQFVGRRDGQVKVRGFRVELTEIEEVIRRFPGIRDATVAAFDDPAGGKFVAAYVVSDEPVSESALADFIRSEKPPYMVPAVIVPIDKIPLNQNQKVNKKALPVPQRKAGKITPPETDTQKKLFEVIAGVIGHEEFGIDTDIYEAGLTSIGAVRLNVELAEAFEAPIRIADIKANPTILALEAFFAAAAPAAAYERQADYPITETQSGIFVECMAAPGTTAYNIPVLVRLDRGVDPDRLSAALQAAVNAHPYVKTTLFSNEQGDVRAARNDDAPVTVTVHTCKTLPEPASLVRPFTLLGEPLYRLEVFCTEEANYLFMDIHHILCDGTSEGVLFEDISRAYAGETLTVEEYSGFEAALEEKAVRESDRYNAAKAYWKNRLADYDAECLPKPDPEGETGAGQVVLKLPDTQTIRDYCRQHQLSLNAYFNSVFAFVLSRFSGKDEVGYATVFNGRSDSRLARAVTLLARTVPVTASLKGDQPVAEFVREMQAQLMDGMTHDACSFAELSRDHGAKADIMLVYQGDNFTFDSLCGYPATVIALPSDTAKAPISVTVTLQEDRWEYVVEYEKDQYSRAFAESLAYALDAAAHSFVAGPLVKNVSMLSEHAEEAYARMNSVDIPVEPVTVIDLFERCAAATPDAPGVTSCGRTLTYGELNRQVNRMANRLLAFGVKREDIVGLVLDRSCEIPLTQLAIMKAGGAFVSALPEYPDERIEYCLTDAASPFVITTEALRRERPALFGADKPFRTLTLEELLAEGGNEENPGTELLQDQLAYCIYTSGSTGKPKGVMIRHGNLTNTVVSQWNILPYYRSDSKGAALASCSVSFDASVMEIFIPLCSGKELVMCTDEEHMNPLAMKELILSRNVEMMIGTPSYLSNLTTMPQLDEAFANIGSIIVGAEAFPAALYESLRRCSPNMRIVNEYGPSECTVACSYKVLESGEHITIGGPTGNMKLFVMDSFGNVLPPYAVGELIICGPGVGRGYVNLPEKNAACYFTLRGLPAYHSGDVVRLNGDAELEFGGRMDNQVKLRGFRVELDEIEKVMQEYGPVRQSKVLVRNNGTEDYLVGFYTAEEPVEPETLAAHMKSRLTYYMVPAVLMQLPQMPLTVNGKIDKNGFPEVQKATAKKAGRKAPKKSLEQRLCEVFASVLGQEELYADDNFFEMGGTSLTASKVTMVLMSDGIEVKYGDIFDHPTPETLAAFVEERDSAKTKVAAGEVSVKENTDHPALSHNTIKYAPQVTRQPLGNVLLTGAVGFLGIHVLRELIQNETGHIWCLVRKGKHETAQIRLRTMLVYYFSDGFADAMENRISIIDADITDAGLGDVLNDVPFDTVINCAACVKHFTDDDILTRINVHGVENLIEICQRKNARMVQISTVSVPGIHTPETYEKQVRMHENELFVIDDMDNKYGISKYQAELRMLDAIEAGMRGKIIRVGNLMGRHSDGEFQANMETNMFLSGIRGFSVMGKYPISHMTDPMRFSPVDCTARAVVLLAGTDDQFTAFNCDNRYGFDEMKIIDACNRNGITILPEADEKYYAEFRRKLGDDSVNSRLNGLAAYDIQDAHAVETDNRFTTNILYRIGFSWPLVDEAYLERAINSIMTLDYFELPEEGSEDE